MSDEESLAKRIDTATMVGGGFLASLEFFKRQSIVDNASQLAKSLAAQSAKIIARSNIVVSAAGEFAELGVQWSETGNRPSNFDLLGSVGSVGGGLLGGYLALLIVPGAAGVIAAGLLAGVIARELETLIETRGDISQLWLAQGATWAADAASWFASQAALSVGETLDALNSAFESGVSWARDLVSAAQNWMTSRLDEVVSLVEEFASGLVDELVDAVPDWMATLSALFNPPPIDPLVIDLDGDGIELTALNRSSAFFDLDGDGFRERTGWVSPDDGLLALDRNGDGRIDGINELFGSATTSGYEVLRALDSNRDGRITSQDAQFSSLRIWRDLDGDGVSDAGELASLAQTGITSISLAASTANLRINGNDVVRTAQVSFADGLLPVSWTAG